MKFEHKAPIFALALAALVPACYIVTEKPADSAPPAVATPSAPAATPVATITAPPLTTTTAPATTTPPPAHLPPTPTAAKPAPTVAAVPLTATTSAKP